MKLRLEDKNRAIDLRIQGKTYSEIRSKISNLSKSTLSGWLSKMRLTPKQSELLKGNLERINYNARVKAGWTKKAKKREKIRVIFQQAENEYQNLKNNNLFLIGLSLYWAEGNKKTEMFQFTNSDPEAIKIVIKWLVEIYLIPKEKIKIRLYIHKVYAHENCEKFWSKTTGIPYQKFQKTIYKPTAHKMKKNPDYKGCIQLRVLKTDFYWKVMGLIKALINDQFYKRPL